MAGLDRGQVRNLRKGCLCDVEGDPCARCDAADELLRLYAIIGNRLMLDRTTAAELVEPLAIVLADDEIEWLIEESAEWERSVAWARTNNSDPRHLVPIRDNAGDSS